MPGGLLARIEFVPGSLRVGREDEVPAMTVGFLASREVESALR